MTIRSPVDSGRLLLVISALGVAVASASYATDLLDKAIACGLVCVILRGLPRTLAARFPALAR